MHNFACFALSYKLLTEGNDVITIKYAGAGTQLQFSVEAAEQPRRLSTHSTTARIHESSHRGCKFESTAKSCSTTNYLLFSRIIDESLLRMFIDQYFCP